MQSQTPFVVMVSMQLPATCVRRGRAGLVKKRRASLRVVRFRLAIYILWSRVWGSGCRVIRQLRELPYHLRPTLFFFRVPFSTGSCCSVYDSCSVWFSFACQAYPPDLFASSRWALCRCSGAWRAFRYRGTSLVRPRHPPRTTIGP